MQISNIYNQGCLQNPARCSNSGTALVAWNSFKLFFPHKFLYSFEVSITQLRTKLIQCAFLHFWTELSFSSALLTVTKRLQQSHVYEALWVDLVSIEKNNMPDVSQELLIVSLVTLCTSEQCRRSQSVVVFERCKAGQVCGAIITANLLLKNKCPENLLL